MTKANEDKFKVGQVLKRGEYDYIFSYVGSGMYNFLDTNMKGVYFQVPRRFEECMECIEFNDFEIVADSYEAYLSKELEAKDKKIEELKKQVEELDTKLSSEETRIVGIMHFVDKWIEIDDADKFGNIILQQDEVQRAQFVRQKTLEIMEEQAEEIESLKSENTKLKELVGVYEEGFRKIKIMTAVSFTEIPHVEVITILQNLIKDMKDEAQTALDKGEQIKEK